ncbi:MAG TPA: D-alanyl-D-alanine carboxypeptidase/D-alanyl-D-alanine-endopeptidase [Gammaproteobacteria bacterium]|jgi:D-alanyl-D-alanine carboxypeptidase/D-alanyl-D-alanine-endopeptidase (penicillin-binding protein 4)|nr:D-alanyl-D-alanine carboxypeptidase/D-alanyl-D-alanine-endopeptidase [Gammaproteobacteria bacterium]
MRFFQLLLAVVLIFSIAESGLAASSKKSSRHTVKTRVLKKTSAHKVRFARKRVSTAPRRVAAESSGIELPTQINGKNQLSYVLSRIISSYDTSSADIGVYIKSLRTGQTLYVRNIYQPMVPASIMKILTAEAALIYLGPNYRFATQLLTDARGVHDGVLQGNLYIVLSGDPSLTYPDVVDLMMNLQNQGISAISGNVYIDNTAYDQRFYGPGWSEKDKSYYYGAPISASIINHNVLPLSMQPSQPGRKATVITSPVHFYPGIRNNVVTRSSRRDCALKMTTSVNSSISLDGCLAKSATGWGVNYVVTDIPEYNRTLFKSLLRRIGVDVYGTVTFGSAKRSLSVVGTHYSDPLPELIHDMLKKSDNVIAGALFKKLGQLYSHRPGSWENGSIAVSSILSKTAGVQTKGMRLLDGSGLSVNNLASPSQFMQVLQYAYSNAKTGDYFIPALPVAGVDGTLKRRMTNITRKIRAKTGTINGVVSLAGYATSYDKDPLAFVIIVNANKGLNWRYKGMEDKIATALTRFTD